jgi:hypothetical protein
VRIILRFVLIGLLVLMGIVFLGPYAPSNWFVNDWAMGMREAMNAQWGFPMGLPGT